MSALIVSSREVARAAMSFPFDPVALAPQTTSQAVTDAIEGYRRAMIPASQLTKGERQADQKTLGDLIRAIGLRIRPEFSEDQAECWIGAMVQALEDQPLRIAIAAAREAIHVPTRFPGEVLGVIQAKAEPHAAQYRRALANLEKLLREIENPTPKIEASPEAERFEIPIDELSAFLRGLWISVGILIDDGNGGLRYSTDEEWSARQQAIRDERGVARAREVAE